MNIICNVSSVLPCSRQILMGPNAAMGGQTPGMMGPMVPGMMPPPPK